VQMAVEVLHSYLVNKDIVVVKIEQLLLNNNLIYSLIYINDIFTIIQVNVFNIIQLI